MPKSSTEDTGVSSWSRKGTLMSDTLLRSCLVPKKMSFVFLGFISNWCETCLIAGWCCFPHFYKARIHVFSRKGAVDLSIVNVGVGKAGLNCGR